jgi:hypothetical protein
MSDTTPVPYSVRVTFDVYALDRWQAARLVAEYLEAASHFLHPDTTEGRDIAGVYVDDWTMDAAPEVANV